MFSSYKLVNKGSKQFGQHNIKIFRMQATSPGT